MSRIFYPATAEQLVAAVEAVYVSGKADAASVAHFCDLPEDHAKRALGLGVDLGFLRNAGSVFEPVGPLCRFLILPDEEAKAAVVRILIESYEPFQLFLDRLRATGSVDAAARQTRELLDLDANREEVKDTLISLGGYTRAIRAEGAGRYSPVEGDAGQALVRLGKACDDMASAEKQVRQMLGTCADAVSRDNVFRPLAEAALKAMASQAKEAVTAGGNAVESYLSELASRMNVNVANAHGINAKLEEFQKSAKLSKKLVGSGKYLGYVRNAADHGVDSDTGASWAIQETTGRNYVQVACSFIRACYEREHDGPFMI